MKDLPPTPASTLDRCRACDSAKLILFLPMGDHPPANMFVAPDQRDDPQPAFPLNTQACLGCGMIQVADQIPADFFRHYLYVPSSARTMHGHFENLATVLVGRAGGGLIVDIGCNDGLMLGFANRMGGRTLGVDPAANLAEAAARDGVDVHVAYFSVATAAELVARHGKARVISTTNTLNHIGDLMGFMQGIDLLMAEDGWFVIEVPWALEILRTNEFDNVYHEHMSEMSLRAVCRLAERSGMAVVDVTRLPVHGGSMRVFVRKKSVAGRPSDEVRRMLQAEVEIGMCDAQSFRAFADRVHGIGGELRQMLAGLKRDGARIAGYGAPAKGNTLLNFFDIGPEVLDYLVDRNPLKQNLLSPGRHIPIHDPNVLEDDPPDYLLVLAWNFFDEIREQLAGFEAAGGRFILPLPTPRIVP
ncbi:MAG: class I SAM-dependent methyltransferase [Celeribacter sp.]|jgi:hypothetical protein